MRPPQMRKTSVSNAGGSFPLDVFDDEQHFAGFDQAELAAGRLFDGRGLFTKAASGLTQLGIFGARAFQRSLQCRVVAARLEQRKQSLFAGNGVDDDDERDEEEDVTEQTAAAAGQRWLRRCGDGSRWCVFALGHGLGELTRAGRSGSLLRR